MKLLENITVLVPVYNEEENIPVLFKRFGDLASRTAVTLHFLLVDDGSIDSSPQLIKDYVTGKSNWSALFLSRNFGHPMALSAGFSVVSPSCDAVFVMDADLQDPPELLPEFIARMQSGYDVVYGIRRNRKENFLKRVTYQIYYRLQSGFSNVSMPLDAGDYSLISKRIIEHLKQMPEESRYLRGLRSWIGFRQTGLEYNRSKRFSGSSKYSFRSLLKLAFNGIFNFSEFPIRFIGLIGLVSIGISLLYLAITIYKKFAFNTVPEGFTALIFAIVLFSGVQLLSLAIIGEYILRIFFQVKQRPLFIIGERIIDGKPSDE